MAYTKQTWADGAGGGTPINAERLGVMETGINDAHVGIAAPTVPIGILWIAGRYYNGGQYSTSSSTAAGSGRMLMYPVFFSAPRVIDRIGVSVSASTADGAVRCGIWASNPTTFMPTTVLVDSGSLSATTNGQKEGIVSATINGLVWFGAVVSGTTAPTLIALAGSMIPNFGGASVMGSGINHIGRDGVATTSALPSLEGLTPSYAPNGGSAYSVWVRAA